jgi:hypothetical protein
MISEIPPELPDFSKVNLSFSRCHMLDHRPFSARCGRWYPGSVITRDGDVDEERSPKSQLVRRWKSGWHHLHLAWWFKWRDRFRRKTLCRLGWHRPGQWFAGRGSEEVTWRACHSCFKRFGSNQPVDRIKKEE